MSDPNLFQIRYRDRLTSRQESCFLVPNGNGADEQEALSQFEALGIHDPGGLRLAGPVDVEMLRSRLDDNDDRVEAGALVRLYGVEGCDHLGDLFPFSEAPEEPPVVPEGTRLYGAMFELNTVLDGWTQAYAMVAATSPEEAQDLAAAWVREKAPGLSWRATVRDDRAGADPAEWFRARLGRSDQANYYETYLINYPGAVRVGDLEWLLPKAEKVRT